MAFLPPWHPILCSSIFVKEWHSRSFSKAPIPGIASQTASTQVSICSSHILLLFLFYLSRAPIWSIGQQGETHKQLDLPWLARVDCTKRGFTIQTNTSVKSGQWPVACGLVLRLTNEFPPLEIEKEGFQETESAHGKVVGTCSLWREYNEGRGSWMKGDRTDEKTKTKVLIFHSPDPVLHSSAMIPTPRLWDSSQQTFNKSLAADALSACTSLRIVSFCCRALVFPLGNHSSPTVRPWGGNMTQA